MWALNKESVLFQQIRNCFRYVTENEIKGGVLGWNTSVHICIMNLHVSVGEYVFHFFLVIWCLKWLRHSVYLPCKGLIRRIGYTYNCSPCEVDLPYKTLLSHGLLTGFTDWCMYVYIYFWERWHHRVTFDSLFL